MEEKKADSKTSKQTRPVKTIKRATTFSNPFLVREVMLHTTPAQIVFDTVFDECAIAMRNLSSVLPTLVKNASEMMAVNGAVDHQLNNAMAEIRKEEARIKKIAEDNGIQIDKLEYTNIIKHQAKLTCGKAGQFLQTIIEMDKLLCLVHSAWFAGFIPDDVKASLERQWRRKIIGVSAEIKNITNRAFRAAESKQTSGNGAEDASTAGVDEQDLIVKPEKTKRTKKHTDVPVAAVTEPAAQVAIA